MLNYNLMLLVEYGIETIAQAVSWGKALGAHSFTLIQKVKDALGITPDSDPYVVDWDLRHKYARKVAKCIRWTRYDAEFIEACELLFIQLRLGKHWKLTEIAPVEEMILALQNTGLFQFISTSYSVWKVHYVHIADLMGRKLTPIQICRMLNMIRPYLEDRDTHNMSTYRWHFRQGFHLGEWFTMVIKGIRPSHVKRFDRFMRVFKHTHKITTHITGRFFTGERGTTLNELSDSQLKMTVTDVRNWVNERKLKFRFNVVVKTAAEWQPMRYNHITDQVWLSQFGRVPTDKSVRDLPSDVIRGFSKASFGGFISEYKILGLTTEQSHVVLALAKLHIWFGKSWKNAVGYGNCEPDMANIHGRGINLPSTVNENAKTFLKRYTHKWTDAVRIASSWQLLADQGINPLGKEGLATSLKFLASMLYERVMDIPFAQECAKWGKSQSKFEALQSIWMGREFKYSSIPKIALSEGDWKFYLLDRDDPRGPFLGEYTGCCQHPDGAGSSCAWHGTTKEDGGFVVLEYQGAIKFQSWVWRKDATLVFDNIEGNCASNLYENAKRIYLEGVRSFRGKFGIDFIFIGKSYSRINFDEFDTHERINAPYGCYSDANTTWEVI
jgi:hypothetical protein